MKPSDIASAGELMKLGQTKGLTIEGFDQDGHPFLEAIPAASFIVDNEKVNAVSGNSISSLAVGDAHLMATVKGPKGDLVDGVKITNVTAVQELTSIKVRFTDPGAAPADQNAAAVAKTSTAKSPGWGK